MLNHNGKIYENKNTPLFSAQNRAFSYADALFETIRIVRNDTFDYSIPFFIPLWKYHFKRLSTGMQAFGYDKLESNFLKNEILKTVALSVSVNSSSDFKVRLTVFRSEGGLYTPTSSKPEFVIVVQEIDKLTTNLTIFDDDSNVEKLQKSYVFFDELPLFPSNFSAFKKVDALPYILAGKYRKEQQADEVFLLNNQGRIAEAGAANVFILDKNVSNQEQNKFHFRTPPASEGGVMGTLRNYILDLNSDMNLDKKDNFEITVEEKIITKEELNQSEVIFTTNAVQSIQIIKITTQKQIEVIKKWIEKMNYIFL